MWDWMLLPFYRYFEVKGRSRRKEYWLFTLFLAVTNLILVTAEQALGLQVSHIGILSSIYSLLTIIPAFTVCIRRLHDINYSGWWLLITFVPVVGILYLVYLACRKGTEGPNRFGGDPLAL